MAVIKVVERKFSRYGREFVVMCDGVGDHWETAIKAEGLPQIGDEFPLENRRHCSRRDIRRLVGYVPETFGQLIQTSLVCCFLVTCEYVDDANRIVSTDDT